MAREVKTRRYLVSGWLWSIGLFCLGLPFLWWPKPFHWLMLIHAAVFIAALGWVVRSGDEGCTLDPKRSPVRGALGVLAYSAVIFGGIFSYRAIVL